MKKQTMFFKGIFMFLCLGISALLMVSCSEDSDETPTPENEPNVLVSNNAQFGNILVDDQGRTLYFFTRDPQTISNCTGGCLDVWPIFFEENLIVGTGLSAADFGVITRGDGQKQNTFKGWPLYYYSPNSDGVIEAAGQTQGENVGSVWFVAKPDYDVMLAKQTVGGSEIQYLVDLSGRTLYYFTNDSNNTSNCDGTCEDNWPLFKIDVNKLPSSLTAADFGIFTRTDGQQQATYRGWPLYYYNSDSQRGETKGHNVGGVWFVTDEEAAQAPE
ncbi:MAG: hypothetical protein NW226_19415 [Microscillaceae bacterium]|nr:hypothetical protein [Microscillaceae bacterium]